MITGAIFERSLQNLETQFAAHHFLENLAGSGPVEELERASLNDQRFGRRLRFDFAA